MQKSLIPDDQSCTRFLLPGDAAYQLIPKSKIT
jgi:hypothetical protein